MKSLHGSLCNAVHSYNLYLLKDVGSTTSNFYASIYRIHSRENKPHKQGGSRKKAGKVNKFANKNKKGQTTKKRGGKR